MRNLFGKLDSYFSELHGSIIIAISLVLVALLGWLDYLSGFEASFSFFYLIPIFLSALYTNVRFSLMITAVSILAWAFSNILAGQTHSSALILYWNALIRLGTFSMIALLVNELKFVITREQTISRTDFLTGLNNRREFNRVAQLEIMRAGRHKHHFAVAYIDLDLFKDVNDRLGHAAGDELLQTIAQIMRNTLRKTDVIARMGGDEFAILLTEIDGKGAKRAIEKVQERLLDKMSQDQTGVTFSIGLVYYTRPPKSAEELLRGADNLMYRAKVHGKNKIVFEQVE